MLTLSNGADAGRERIKPRCRRPSCRVQKGSPHCPCHCCCCEASAGSSPATTIRGKKRNKAGSRRSWRYCCSKIFLVRHDSTTGKIGAESLTIMESCCSQIQSRDTLMKCLTTFSLKFTFLTFREKFRDVCYDFFPQADLV